MMTPRENALELARTHRRFAIWFAAIDEVVHRRGYKLRHYNRHLDLWWYYRMQAAKKLPTMTVRQQLEAFGWTRRDGQTVRISDGARPATVACHPAVTQVQQWIICGCPAEKMEVRRVA